jgi:hypothetical protein
MPWFGPAVLESGQRRFSPADDLVHRSRPIERRNRSGGCLAGTLNAGDLRRLEEDTPGLPNQTPGFAPQGRCVLPQRPPNALWRLTVGGCQSLSFR